MAGKSKARAETETAKESTADTAGPLTPRNTLSTVKHTDEEDQGGSDVFVAVPSTDLNGIVHAQANAESSDAAKDDADAKPTAKTAGEHVLAKMVRRIRGKLQGCGKDAGKKTADDDGKEPAYPHMAAASTTASVSPETVSSSGPQSSKDAKSRNRAKAVVLSASEGMGPTIKLHAGADGAATEGIEATSNAAATNATADR